MRIPFIAANWKMFKTVHEAVVFAKEFRSLVKDLDGRRDRRRAAVHGAPRRRRGRAELATRRRRRRICTGSGRGVHRRSQRRRC